MSTTTKAEIEAEFNRLHKTPAELRALRERLGTLTICTRLNGDTYTAKASGIRRRATCTMGPSYAAQRLAVGIYGVTVYYISVEPIAEGIYRAYVIDPESLSTTEALALWSIIEAGGSGDIYSPLLATTLRNLSNRRPDLLTLANVEPDSTGAKPYFGAAITAAGREAYAAVKGGK